MDLNQFENKKSEQEKIIEAEAFGESSSSFAHHEMEKIKSKLENRKKKQQKLKRIFISLVSVIIILASIVGYSQYRLYKLSQEEVHVVTNSTTPTTPGDVIIRLGKHILLPEGEPQIAEIQDIEKLRSQQAFFKNAENGDIVVLYSTTIFIYRPSRDIVVASGDVSGLGQVKP